MKKARSHMAPGRAGIIAASLTVLFVCACASDVSDQASKGTPPLTLSDWITMPDGEIIPLKPINANTLAKMRRVSSFPYDIGGPFSVQVNCIDIQMEYLVPELDDPSIKTPLKDINIHYWINRHNELCKENRDSDTVELKLFLERAALVTELSSENGISRLQLLESLNAPPMVLVE